MLLFLLAAAGAASSPGGQAAPARDLPKRLERRAETGNAEARYHLGMLYNSGIVVAKDPRRAYALFRAAASAGDPLAHYKVGCYHAGEFGPEIAEIDPAKALRHKLVAAEAGYRLAQLDVANLYTGRKDYARALPWYEAAARQGDPQALYNLSVFARDGLGMARAPAKLWAFFRLAHRMEKGAISAGAQDSLDRVWQGLSVAEREEARRIEATWMTGSTTLTRQALRGVTRAEEVAAAAP